MIGSFIMDIKELNDYLDYLKYQKNYSDYTINNYSIFVIGGAYSVDKWWRLRRAGVNSKLDVNYNNPKKTGWFMNEQLSAEEMVRAGLELGNKYYDFVFTHTCPISFQPTDLFLGAVNQSEVDNTMELWLDEFKDMIDWDVWCFGHYHADRLERPHVEQYFNDIENLDIVYKRWVDYDNNQELDWWLQKSPNFYMK